MLGGLPRWLHVMRLVTDKRNCILYTFSYSSLVFLAMTLHVI